MKGKPERSGSDPSGECRSRLPLCSILTAPAPSGIAVILLKGPGAEGILARSFRRPGRKPLPRTDRAAFGLIEDRGRTLDEAIVVRTACPPQEAFEVCCHGGTAAARAIVGLFVESGARELPWSRLVPPRTLEYELLEALLAADGEIQAALIAHLQQGVLRGALSELVGILGKGCRDKDGTKIDGPFRDLLETFRKGRFLAAPPLVLIAGAANAGKSTLFNAILGESRALTSPLPGTTRDPVEARFLLDGFPVRLVDTAGFERSGSDRLTGQGRSIARRLIAESDAVICLVNDEAGEIAEEAPAEWDEARTAVLPVRNKHDLRPRSPGGGEPSRVEGSQAPLPVSALLNEGLDSLLEKLAACLGLDDLARLRTAVLITERQRRLVEEALEAVESGRDPVSRRNALIRYLGDGR